MPFLKHTAAAAFPTASWEPDDSVVKSEQKLRQARSRLAFYYEKLEKASVHSKKCFQLAKKRKEEKDDARKAYEEAVMKEMEASLEEENSTQNILYNAYLDA